MLTEGNVVDVLNQLDYQEAWIVAKLWNEYQALTKENRKLHDDLAAMKAIIISERRGTT